MNEEYFSKVTPEEKEIIQKIYVLSSLDIPRMYGKILETLKEGSNQSFNVLPDDVQRNILVAGLLTTDFFKKSKVSEMKIYLIHL